jgi:hypothetical protein
MKISKVLHVLSVIVGFAGIITALLGAFAGADKLIFGLTREHILLCAGLLVLIAIWFTISTIHHMKLEEKGSII